MNRHLNNARQRASILKAKSRRRLQLKGLPKVNPKILRAAKFSNLSGRALRALVAAGTLVAVPEFALAAAGLAAVAGAAYFYNKSGQVVKVPTSSPIQPVKRPAVGIVVEEPVVRPTKPINTPAPTKPPIVPTTPMAPIKRNGGQGGRKKMWVPKMTPVSTISKAPVAIGNTIRGTQTIDRMTKIGRQCIGRDFMFTPIAPGAVANWTMIGGCPLSPTAFADSVMRQYAQLYNKFRFLQFTAHFITSSPTSTNGDIMFYYAKNRESVFLNQTSTNLLPFVMSDPNAVLGPQWQNISATFDVDSEWKSLDYGMDDNPAHFAAGELFLLCKTSNTESPGYVLFDYVIEFGEKSIQPRLLSLPITREIYTQLGVGVAAGTTVINTPYALRVAGNNISGAASAYPIGINDGDVYKVIVDTSNSTLGAGSTNVTTSNYGHEIAGSTGGIGMSDGFTCYAVYNANTNGFYFYLNATAAFSGSPNRIFWASATGAITMVLQIWVSYIGSVNFVLANTPNF